MKLSAALRILRRTVYKNKRHPYYPKVVALSNEYHMLVTGEGQDDEIEKMYENENDLEKEQRKKLTRPITPTVFRMVSNAYARARRIAPAVFNITIDGDKDGESAKKVLKAGENWNGEGKSLMKWMLADLYMRNEIDPNACYILETRDYNPNNEEIPLFTYIASSEQMLNFKRWGEYFEWAIVKDDAYEIEGELIEEPKYATYTDQWAIELEQIPIKDDEGEYTEYYALASQEVQMFDPQFPYSISTEPNSNPVEYYVTFDEEEENKDRVIYRMTINLHGIGFAPVFSVGYIKSKANRGNTFVNLLDDVKGLLYDIMDMWSERSLTYKLYIHPIVTIYIPKCPKVGNVHVNCEKQKKRCGKKNCTTCHREKYLKTHTVGMQRVNVYTFDVNDKPSIKDLDITKTLHFSQIPSDIVQEINAGIESMINMVMYATIGKQNVAQTEVEKTATMALMKQQIGLDGLFMYMQKAFSLTRLKYKAIAGYMGVDVLKTKVTITESETMIPQSMNDLIEQAKNARDAGVSEEVLDRTNSRLIEKAFEDNPDEVRMIATWRSHIPLLTKSESQQKESLAAAGLEGGISVFEAFLFYYHPVIRYMIEESKDGADAFYTSDYTKQRTTILQKAIELKQQMAKSEGEFGDIQSAESEYESAEIA